MTFLNAVQFFLLGLLTLVMGVPAILLALLMPGKTWKGKLFLVVSRTYARIALWFFRIQVVGRGLANIGSGEPYVCVAEHARVPLPGADVGHPPPHHLDPEEPQGDPGVSFRNHQKELPLQRFPGQQQGQQDRRDADHEGEEPQESQLYCVQRSHFV